MSYIKQTWTRGDTITADKLNHMEDGIASGGVFIVEQTQSGNTYTLNKTWNEIYNAVASGKICYLSHLNGFFSLAYIANLMSFMVMFTGFSETYETSTADSYPSYTFEDASV